MSFSLYDVSLTPKKIMLDLYRIITAIWIWFFVVAGWSGAEASILLDSTFGLNGRVAVEVGQKNRGYALLPQANGTVIIAGSSSVQPNGPQNFTLLRLDQNGQLDPGFNQEGYTVSSLVPDDDEALAIGQLSDGRLVVGGYSSNGEDRDFALACFFPDGKLDTDFGDNGATLSAIGSGHEEITALTVDPADNIIVVGASQGTVGKILVAARYLPSGKLDSSFGEEGIALLGVGDDANVEGVLLRTDGSIILSGSYIEEHKQAAMLVGLRSDGSLDTRFGDQGVVSLMDSFATSEGYALAQDRHGLLYLAGSVGEMGERTGALFRFTANGSLDFAFGENGAMLIGQSPEDDVLYDVVVQRETIRVAGFTTTNGTRHFLLASLQPRIQKAEKRKRFFSYQDVAPIQEIRINGNTRVQIRKMQTWTSALLFQKMELLQSILQEPSAQRRKEHKQRENVFFLPLKNWLTPKPAYAATLEDPPPAVGKQNQFEVQILTTDFGGLEAVCYALAIDQYGQLLAVGIAGDADLSTVIATRYVADEVIDEVSDSPGHRSRQIITLPSMDVTQTSLTTGGEISAQFPKEVVRRGVLFSLRSSQSSRSNNNDGAADVLRSGGDFLADIFFPVAVAAESPLPVKQKVSSAQSLEEGITDNGGGTGVFYARLENLFPSSIYSIRAYAMTADGAIYYGDQIYVRTADACFIATASFGSLLHPCVQTLRNFRDAYLMPTVWGQKLVHLYYTISPPVAASIAEHPGLAVVVRILLLPCIAFAWLVLHLGLFPALSLAVVIPFVARRLYVAKAAASAAQ